MRVPSGASWAIHPDPQTPKSLSAWLWRTSSSASLRMAAAWQWRLLSFCSGGFRQTWNDTEISTRASREEYQVLWGRNATVRPRQASRALQNNQSRTPDATGRCSCHLEPPRSGKKPTHGIGMPYAFDAGACNSAPSRDCLLLSLWWLWWSPASAGVLTS